MTAASDRYNQSSKSNGALMRATPLAIFGCYLPATSLAAMAEQDARLSHPNKTCQSCNAAYVAAVGHLISHPGDREGATEVARIVASHPDFDPDVRAWLLEDSLDEPSSLDCEELIGFCRWGFTLAFMFLRTGIRSGRKPHCISQDAPPPPPPSGTEIMHIRACPEAPVYTWISDKTLICFLLLTPRALSHAASLLATVHALLLMRILLLTQSLGICLISDMSMCKASVPGAFLASRSNIRHMTT